MGIHTSINDLLKGTEMTTSELSRNTRVQNNVLIVDVLTLLYEQFTPTSIRANTPLYLARSISDYMTLHLPIRLFSTIHLAVEGAGCRVKYSADKHHQSKRSICITAELAKHNIEVAKNVRDYLYSNYNLNRERQKIYVVGGQSEADVKIASLMEIYALKATDQLKPGLVSVPKIRTTVSKRTLGNSDSDYETDSDNDDSSTDTTTISPSSKTPRLSFSINANEPISSPTNTTLSKLNDTISNIVTSPSLGNMEDQDSMKSRQQLKLQSTVHKVKPNARLSKRPPVFNPTIFNPHAFEFRPRQCQPKFPKLELVSSVATPRHVNKSIWNASKSALTALTATNTRSKSSLSGCGNGGSGGNTSNRIKVTRIVVWTTDSDILITASGFQCNHLQLAWQRGKKLYNLCNLNLEVALLLIVFGCDRLQRLAPTKASIIYNPITKVIKCNNLRTVIDLNTKRVKTTAFNNCIPISISLPSNKAICDKLRQWQIDESQATAVRKVLKYYTHGNLLEIQ